jgi:membrane protease subunit HflK
VVLGEFAEEKRLVFRNLERIVGGVLLALVALYLASGVYVVQANEEGLLRRFGVLQPGTVKPGIHYRIPWPVDRVDRVKIKEVKRIEVGFSPDGAGARSVILPYCITSDRNIIHNRFVIQYRISDPAKYVFNCVDPEQLLRGFAGETIIKVVAARTVDTVLTTGKREVELEILGELQSLLHQQDTGISISSVETKLVGPPRTVSGAFRDVINAREERSTMIHEADNYRNKVIPEAKAKVTRIVEQAEAAKFQRVSAAKGESSRFLVIHEKQVRAPEVIEQHMFLGMVERVLPRVKVLVLATDAEGDPIKVQLVRGALPTVPQLPSIRETPRPEFPSRTPEPADTFAPFMQLDVLRDR